jgi:hypothetical protein
VCPITTQLSLFEHIGCSISPAIRVFRIQAIK